ncbi:MAG: carbon monoxide dehydrogenase subunit G [Pseudomonadota bacterium]
MKLEGARLIPADREAVWEKLNDPDVLKRCIPGCQSLEQTSPTELKATVALKIGPMNVKFSGDVELKDLNPPESYRIEGSGSGGVAGRASGGADVRLAKAPDGTELTYDVDAAVSGKIAQLGQRLIDSTAKKLADQFFDKFQAEFTETDDAPADDTETTASPASAAAHAATAGGAVGATSVAAAEQANSPASSSNEKGLASATAPQGRSVSGSRSSQSPLIYYAAGAVALALITALIVQSF